MRLFYFVGGPDAGRVPEFLARLQQAGGPPPGWRIYPHADGSGKALHLVEAATIADVLAHLDLFADLYEHGDIVEVTERT